MRKFFAALHLWLAVPFGIVITILCLTGAVLVFESEIKEWTNPSLYKASQSGGGEPLSFAVLVETVKTQLPDTVGISSIQVPGSASGNYRLGVAGERRTSVMVDPYTGEVKGVVRPYEKGTFFTFVRRLHRWFLMEVKREGISWGKTITGVTTLVFVFVLVSGIVIWLPRSWKNVKRRFSIKRGAGRFRFWHDFHLSLGKMASVFLLAMALTGLTWSFTWYRNGFYRVFGVEVIQPAAGHGQEAVPSNEASGGTESGSEQRRGGGRPEGAGDGEARRAGEPESDRDGSSDVRQRRDGAPQGSGDGQRSNGDDESSAGGEQERRGRGGRRSGSVDYAAWQKAAAEVIGANPGFRTVSVQDGTVSVAVSNYGNTRASDSYSFDPTTGEITSVSYYRDQPRSAKIRGWIYAVHVGSWGGVYTKILYFIACLIGAALPVTGYYIWLKKRWKKWRKNRTLKKSAPAESI